MFYAFRFSVYTSWNRDGVWRTRVLSKMREGLRSRRRLGKAETDKVSRGGEVPNEGDGIAQEVFDLSGEGLAPERNLTIEKKDVVEQVVKEECGLDWDVSTSRNVDFAEKADIERKAKKGEDSNEVLIGGRVLRSRSKMGNDKENNGVFARKNREIGGFEKIKFQTESEEADEFVKNGYEKERVKVQKEGNGKRELKWKRGRPPKIELKEKDQLVGQLQRKRGRPPKAGLKNKLLTGAHNGKGKVGFGKGKKGLTMRDGANMNAVDDMCSRRSSGKELEKKGFSLGKKSKFGKVLETENNEVASPLRSNADNSLVAEKSGRNKAKQLVREQIIERLSAAGWTVDYRPRNGREYNDAVYVSLDGKTHWSITLAYNTLKKHYEAGDGEGKVYGPGFKFTPIPEEDFNILTKVINKERKSKEKVVQKRGKGGNKVVGFNKKVQKEKLGSGSRLGKSMKRKIKRKWSFLEEDNPNVTLPSRMPVLVRDHKRQKTQNKKRCALLVRNAEKEIDSEVDGYVPYNGKRTVLSWMIDLGTILQNGKAHYMNHKRKCVQLDGKITGDGIQCGCCNKIVTISDFEAHSGSKLSDPLKNIYIEGGTSLLQCLLDSWNKQDESECKGFHLIDVAGEDPNDDACGVCGDGGDLICCDGCPSTFHQSCLDIKKLPSGDWHCIYCCCKFCGLVGGSTNQKDGYDDFTVSTLLTCRLCKQKYHRSCFEANGPKTGDSSDSFFCGNRCQELSQRLEMLLGAKHEIEDEFSWTFIWRSDVGSDASQIKPHLVECNSKLAVALSIMDECFMPYIDHRSGINLIHSVLYNCGSNFNRLNHSGFVTAILERGDEIICAASIRIHGNQLAEMPFIGTRYLYRRQGMCRRLLSAIESTLSSLNVELLVIPAISELRETWTSVFGFEPLELTSKQITKNMNLLVFPHVDMLQKKILKHKFADENLIPAEVSNLQKIQTIYKEANNCDEVGLSGSDLIISAGILPSNACQINDKTMSIESGSRLPDGSLNNTPDITNKTIHHNKCLKDVTCQVQCQAVHDNMVAEDKITVNAYDSVSDTRYQAEDVHTYQNTSSGCIILNHDEKQIDLDNQLNYCCVSEERQFLAVSHISIEATEGGHYVGASSEVTESFPNEVKVAYEVVTNNNSAENSAHHRAESIVSCTKQSKDSSDSIHHDSHKISDSYELRRNLGCVQYSIGSKEVHAESVNCCDSNCRPNSDCASGEVVFPTHVTPNLQTNINSGDCQSKQVSSGFCEKIADAVNDGSKASGVAEANSLQADTNIVLNDKPCMKGPAELAESDLQADQTEWSNAPSLCSPNTASGVALHCASAGGASCGSTEVVVLSNQAS